MIRSVLVAALSAAAVIVGLFVAPMAAAQADPFAELCAATGVEQVDTVLADLDATALEGPLAPLLALTIPQTDGGFALQADVTSNDVREALDCDPAAPEQPAEQPAEETPANPETPGQTAGDADCSDFATQDAAQAAYDAARTEANPDPMRLDSDGDGIACEAPSVVDPIADDGSIADIDGSQVSVVPEGSADTGTA